jgi:SAM-dependent methyltransferase
MSEFSASWLQLREAADARARAAELLAAFTAREGGLGGDDASAGRQARFARIYDLGCGTGANLRYLAPRLGPGQRWRCLDQDPRLLQQLPRLTHKWAQRLGYHSQRQDSMLLLSGPGWDAVVETEQRDLAATEDLQLDPSAGNDGSLITASALLDLVSEAWLARLIEHCRRARCALLLTLNYSGEVALSPAAPLDQPLIDLVNRHQRGDKGFGPALGPSATQVAERLLTAAGFDTQSAPSDWRLGGDEPQLQRALIEGWLSAAREREPGAGHRWQSWQQTRWQQIAEGALEIRVSHRDLVALPRG